MITNNGYAPPDLDLNKFYRYTKKIKKFRFNLIALVPEFKECLLSSTEKISDSMVFLKLRNCAKEMGDNNSLYRSAYKQIKDVSKDIFDDPLFWQRSDEEVFAKINEMKEKGELD